MDVSSAMDTSKSIKEEDDSDVMQDPEFLQSVLEKLPGVDPNKEAIQNAMGSLTSLGSQATKDSKKDKKEENKKWDWKERGSIRPRVCVEAAGKVHGFQIMVVFFRQQNSNCRIRSVLSYERLTSLQCIVFRT